MILHGSEHGEGPPVVLLHGLFGRSQNLGMVARPLSATYRVVSLDLRNHGSSPHTPGMQYAAMAADVLETLAARSALPACLVGHSMGGKVAMMAALTQPGAVSALVVADIAPIAYRHHNGAIAAALQALKPTPKLSRAKADATLASAVDDPLLRSFLLQNLVVGTVPRWQIGLNEIAAGIPDIEGWPLLPESARYDGPTLFLRGEQSDYIDQAAAGVIARLFPASRMVTIKEAGHWLHADQPGAFADSVGHFLRDAVGGEKI